MLAVTEYFKSKAALDPIAAPFVKIIIKNLVDGNDYDLSNFVNRLGSIQRAISYDIGKFSPGNLSIELQDSFAFGKLLFQLGQEFGTEFWMDKTVEIYFGFRDGSTEDLINVFTGQIESKTENRSRGQVSLNIKDFTKEMFDFKVCHQIKGTDVFSYKNNETDNRTIQLVLRYGWHKLILNDPDQKEKKNRDDPWGLTLSEYNLYDAWPGITFPPGGSYAYAGTLWFIPLQNSACLDVSWHGYYSTGELKVYFWDYRSDKKCWTPFAVTNFQAPMGKILLYSLPSKYGVYLWVFDRYLDDFPLGPFEHFGNYFYGTGTVWGDGSGGVNPNRDPKLAIESLDALIDRNPVRILFDLLTSDKILGKSSAMLDYKDFSVPDINYTWDSAYRYFKSTLGSINVRFDNEETLLSIIEQICEVIGCSFFISAQKSINEDRRIKLYRIRPVNIYHDPDPLGAALSTNREIDNLEIETSSDLRYGIITTYNFNPSSSQKDQLELIRVGFLGKELVLGASSNPSVYWYDSETCALAMCQRYYEQLRNPGAKLTFDLGLLGVIFELADSVIIHDGLTGLEIFSQIISNQLDLDKGKTKFTAKQYRGLVYPDDDPNHRWWHWASSASGTPYAYWRGAGHPAPGPNGERYFFF